MRKRMVNESDSEEDTETESTITVTDNIIRFHADVTRSNCFKLIECLDKAKQYVVSKHILNPLDEPSKIYLYIFSDGGEVYAAMTIIDILLSSPIDIITINEGCVASAGVLISLAGSKRYIRKNAYMLIHEIRSGCLGKYSECQDDMKNNDILMDHVKSYMNSRCNNHKLKKKLNKVLKHDHIWPAEKCLKHGLVDKII